MHIERQSQRAKEAQTEAMDRILENHLLYCTVCDNNNGNCKVHNTVHMMGIEEQKYPYEPKVRVKWICHIRFIDMIQINVLLVDSV